MWSWFGDVPEYFVRRGCLDLADRSRPAYEWAMRMAHDHQAVARLFGPESLPTVADYVTAWADDARAMAASAAPFSERSRAVVAAAADRAAARVSTGALYLPVPQGYPIKGFLDQVPLDAGILASARVAAASLCQSWRMRTSLLVAQADTAG
jgi:hypothetical protein